MEQKGRWAEMDLIDTLWNVKGEYHFDVEIANRDLIDTLWNVKDIGLWTCIPALIRFNRYIVECKEVCEYSHWPVEIDLIDTLWNVKTLYLYRRRRYDRDLIDTLWNVKLKGFPIGRTKNGDLIDTLWNVKLRTHSVNSFVTQI